MARAMIAARIVDADANPRLPRSTVRKKTSADRMVNLGNAARYSTVTDPVTRERFRPTAAHERLEHEGRLVWFAKPENATRFRASPEAYVPPMIGMAGE